MLRLSLSRRQSSLIKTSSTFPSTKLAQDDWKLIYSAGSTNDQMAKLRHKAIFGLKKAAQAISAVALVKVILFMGTGAESMLFDIRDAEFLLFSTIVATLLRYYYMPGNVISHVYTDREAKLIRLDQITDSNGKRKSTIIQRNALAALKTDQVQAIFPVMNEHKQIGSIPLTSNTTVHDPLIFELIFGPYAYNCYQFFQRGEKIGLDSVFVRIGRRQPSSRAGFWFDLDRVQSDLRYQRNSIMQQKLRLVNIESIDSWK